MTTNIDEIPGKRNPDLLLVALQTGVATMEIIVENSYKAKSRSAVRPGSSPVGIYLACLHRYLSRSFIDVLFIIAKKWKQSRCPSMDEWVMKMSYIHTVKFCLAVKQKKIVKMSGN